MSGYISPVPDKVSIPEEAPTLVRASDPKKPLRVPPSNITLETQDPAKQGVRSTILSSIGTVLGSTIFRPIRYGISKAALPASFVSFNTKSEDASRTRMRNNFISQNNDVACQRYTLDTKDGASIDAMAIFTDKNSKDADKTAFQNKDNAQNQQWVIFFNPNGKTYEQDLDLMKDYGKKVGANVLVFNYRGVGESKGNPTSGKDLVQDGVRCVQFLREQGIPAGNILIHGHSIGGAVGVKVASLYQGESKDEQMKVISDRSFSSMKVAAAKITAKKTAGFVGSMAGGLFSGFDWKLDTDKAWAKIKTENKAVVFHASDKMVLPEASLQAKLFKQRLKSTKPIEKYKAVQLTAARQINSEDHLTVRSGFRTINDIVTDSLQNVNNNLETKANADQQKINTERQKITDQIVKRELNTEKYIDVLATHFGTPGYKTVIERLKKQIAEQNKQEIDKLVNDFKANPVNQLTNQSKLAEQIQSVQQIQAKLETLKANRASLEIYLPQDLLYLQNLYKEYSTLNSAIKEFMDVNQGLLRDDDVQVLTQSHSETNRLLGRIKESLKPAKGKMDYEYHMYDLRDNPEDFKNVTNLARGLLQRPPPLLVLE